MANCLTLTLVSCVLNDTTQSVTYTHYWDKQEHKNVMDVEEGLHSEQSDNQIHQW